MYLKKTFILAAIVAMATNIFTGFQSVEKVFATEEKIISDSKVIAHGGGMVDGFETSNSVEAVKQSIKNGFELIELDINLTSDDEIVMIHDWERTTLHYLGKKLTEPVTLREFETFKILGPLEPLSFSKLIPILDENPHIRIVTDTKVETIKILTMIAKSYPDYIDRFIPQIYYFEEYEAVEQLGYKDIILTLYLHENPDWDAVGNFAKEKGLYAVTMPDIEADKGLCRVLTKKGVDVFVHPINSVEDANKYFIMGAKKVYSSSLLVKEFESPENEYYLEVTKKGTTEKLVDETFEILDTVRKPYSYATKGQEHFLNIPNLKMSGLNNGEKAVINFDDIEDESLRGLGIKLLKLEIFDKSKISKGSVNYVILNQNSEVRILQEKVQYRLSALKTHKNIEDVSLGEKEKDILRNSLIVKKGESIYYNNGEGKIFTKGKDRLPVREGLGNLALIPMADTLMDLGAKSVTMTHDNAIQVQYNEEIFRAALGSYKIRKGITLTNIKTPVILYLQKAMASGEVFQLITGRPFIEGEEVLLILPLKTEIDNTLKDSLISAARSLF